MLGDGLLRDALLVASFSPRRESWGVHLLRPLDHMEACVAVGRLHRSWVRPRTLLGEVGHTMSKCDSTSSVLASDSAAGTPARRPQSADAVAATVCFDAFASTTARSKA